MHETATLPILLKELKLAAMGRLWSSMAEEAMKEGWNHPRFLTALCEHEVEERYQKRTARYMKLSNLPAGKSLASFDFTRTPSVSKAQVQDLSSNTRWITQGATALIFGPSGVGKSHLASAIGHGLIEKGVRVLFTSTTALMQNLQLARKELKLPAMLDKLWGAVLFCAHADKLQYPANFHDMSAGRGPCIETDQDRKNLGDYWGRRIFLRIAEKWAVADAP